MGERNGHYKKLGSDNNNNCKVTVPPEHRDNSKGVIFLFSSLLVGGSQNCKRTLFFALGLVFAAVVLVIYYSTTTAIDYRLYYTLVQSVPAQETCVIPHTDPWDASIQKYLSKASPLVCKSLQPELTYLTADGQLVFNRTASNQAGYSQLNCVYRCFDRKLNTDDVTLDYGEWKEFQETARPGCEFVEVECKRPFPALSVYINLHNQIIVKTPDQLICGKGKSNNGETINATKKRQPSVILFVLDSISQANWARNLPKTLKVLKDDYGAHVFEGFTKVGDNSLPNAMAFLTGKRVLTAGYEDEYVEVQDRHKDFSDNWPLVWKDFSQEGYVTFYAEDYPQFNLFKYLAVGFKDQPTDHYFRPYWLQLYGSFLHRRSTHLCYGNNPCHRLQLNYLKQFIHKYGQGRPKFALNWLTELGHDWLNQVSMGDEDLASFFKQVKHDLKDSFVFTFSDHGHRFDPIRQSVIGRIEERMPFFSMHVPEWLDREQPQLKQIIKNNTKQLTTFWDVYVTMQDILHSQRTDKWDFSTQDSTFWRKYSKRGLSLLRELPAKRTCEDAGVPEDFCICQRETLVNITDPKVIKAANVLIKHINGMLTTYPKECALLNLKTIHNAQTFLPNLKMILDPSVSIFYGGSSPTGFYVNYRVTIEVEPSEGIFEGTLRNTVHDGVFTVIGDVNRINRYGNQSECIDSPLLRKYCYCVME